MIMGDLVLQLITILGRSYVCPSTHLDDDLSLQQCVVVLYMGGIFWGEGQAGGESGHKSRTEG